MKTKKQYTNQALILKNRNTMIINLCYFSLTLKIIMLYNLTINWSSKSNQTGKVQRGEAENKDLVEEERPQENQVRSGQRTFQLQPSVYVSATVAFARNNGIRHQKRKDERLVVCYREECKMWLACKSQWTASLLHDCAQPHVGCGSPAKHIAVDGKPAQRCHDCVRFPSVGQHRSGSIKD